MSKKYVKSSFLKSTKREEWITKDVVLTTPHKAKIEIVFLELDPTKIVHWEVQVDDLDKPNPRYNMILGRDLLAKLGLTLNFANHTITCHGGAYDGCTTKMVDLNNYNFADTNRNSPIAYTDEELHEAESVQQAPDRVKRILDAHYQKADLAKVVNSNQHLDATKRQELLALLKKHEQLFDGTLGTWRTAPVELKIRKDAKPYHARAFPVPRIYDASFKREIERLCKLGVLRKVNHSEWGAPSFIIPKKNGTVRFLSDFRELNKALKRFPYPMPKIQDMLMKLEGFQYASSLDLNMGYYHIQLLPSASKLCTIVLPWGKYEYLRLPMGINNAPNIFQEKCWNFFTDLNSYERT